jgi:hypothetical protein
MSTPTTEFIRRMDRCAADFTRGRVMIAVGWRNGSETISSARHDRQQLLDQAIDEGGKPIGLIAFKEESPGLFSYSYFLFPEYLGDAVAEAFLADLTRTVAEDQVEYLAKNHQVTLKIVPGSEKGKEN